jgi:hypothetical protein
MAENKFKRVLSDAIDKTFSSLGESPKKSIEFHLENTFGLKTSEYPNDVAGFDRALKDIFGPGAFLLETTILNKLNETALSLQDDKDKENFFENIRRLNDLWQKNP